MLGSISVTSVTVQDSRKYRQYSIIIAGTPAIHVIKLYGPDASANQPI